MPKDVQLCLTANIKYSAHAQMKSRNSPSCDRSCVKMADRFQSIEKQTR